MMVQQLQKIPSRRDLSQRFWSAARQFWVGPSRRLAWLLTIGNVLLVFLQLAAQFRLNVWNRDIFNALEQKDSAAVLHQALLFVPLTVAIVGFGVAAVYGRTALEISEEEAIPLGTAKTRIRTGLIRLRAAVEHLREVVEER